MELATHSLAAGWVTREISTILSYTEVHDWRDRLPIHDTIKTAVAQILD